MTGDAPLEAIADRAPGAREKLSVSLAEDLASGLEVRHPGLGLADVLRSIVLATARAPTGAPASVDGPKPPEITLTVPVSTGVERFTDRAVVAKVVRGFLRRSVNVEPEPTMEIAVPAELLPTLDRVRGAASREALVSQLVERGRLDELTRVLRRHDRVRTEVVDPRQFGAWLEDCLADAEWPEGTIHVVREPGSELGDEIRRRLEAKARAVVVVARELEQGPEDTDPVRAVHAAIVQAIQQAGQAASIQVAPVVFPDGRLWLVAEVSFS